jgi:signal transduction histidine kinase/CheY-like chemotaxis protein
MKLMARLALAMLAAEPQSLWAAGGGSVLLDRAVVSWGLLALLLAVGCIVVFQEWRHGRLSGKQQGHLETLFRLSESILGASDREELLERAANAAVRVGEMSHAFILLIDPSGRQLVYFGGTETLPRTPIPVNAISGAVACFRSRETTEVPDAESCPFLDKDVVRRRGQKSVFYAPILAGESCLGVVEVEERGRRRGFTPQQRARIEHVARLTAVGLRMLDQRLMTEQLHRSEKLAAISELAGAISKELEDPFEEIRELAENAPYGATADEMGVRLADVARLVDRAAATVEKLVRFATPSAGSNEEIDLNALLRRLVADLRKRRDAQDLQVKLGLSKRTPLIYGDATHIQQVFQILLRHAMHYLGQIGGKNLQINTTRREHMVVISLTPLVRPDQALKSTLANREGAHGEGGSSLGLSVCQSLIERAGGTLQIDRNSSLGFRIEVEYPLAEDPWQTGETDTMRESPASIRAGSMTILIVDPDPAVQQSLVQYLSDQSYRAIPVSTAEAALEISERIRFEWVFCDLRLQPMSAVELWQRLRNRVDRFVFLADEAASAQDPEIFAGEGRAVLSKPFSADDVENLIDALLRTSVVFTDG